MKFLLGGLLLFLLVSCKNQSPVAQTADTAFKAPVVPVNQVSQALKDSMARFLDVFLPQQRFSGGILVVKDGQTIYERYMGFTGENKELPVTDTTPFHVASTSKTVTSHAVLQLMAIGKLQLGDSVTKYFPAFPYPNITIRNLLNHTSGLRNYAYFFPEAKWSKKIVATNQDVLDVMVKNKPSLEFATGTRFRYCNTNFSLLALLVEEISGLSFPDYVQQYIFNPAGMTHSYILGVRNQERYMPSWTAGGRRLYDFEYLDAIYGDKNLYTTCQDMRAYDSAITNHLLLPQAYYDTAWMPMSADRHSRDAIEYYGLGWRLKVWDNGNKIPYHNGWWHGNNSVFQHLYQDNAVIIATGNVYNSSIYKLGRLANFFRPYYNDPNTTAEPAPEADDPSTAPTDTISTQKQKVQPKLPDPKKRSTRQTKAPVKKEKATKAKAATKKSTTTKKKAATVEKKTSAKKATTKKKK